MHLYTNPKTKKQTLFVGNNVPEAEGDDTVEIFDVQADGMLKHRRTVQHTKFANIDEVYGLSEDKFYVTIFSNRKGEINVLYENAMFLAGGELYYYDGKDLHLEDKDILFANGVVMSKDGKYVFVGET